MKRVLLFCTGLLLCLGTLLPLSSLRKAMPPVDRLGRLPSPGVTYFASLEHKGLVSELVFYRTMFYYGALAGEEQRPDYMGLYTFVDTATRLNPYNIDAYYFAQAMLTWDAGMVKGVNVLLERGLARRSWDADLAFYLAFNNYYFLHDFDTAAKYFEVSARLNPQVGYFATLTARALYQANKTDIAIAYLKNLLWHTTNATLRKQLAMRLDALERIAFLEKARHDYEQKADTQLRDLEELVRAGVLKAIPPDPYGGVFYIDRNDGRIKTTSNLADTRNRK
ncbi:MAG: hypothetical protein FPO08_06690 [Geobacter sp.]|nr:MAG: hypothetical protein FPO08_06690 [Geobacter sp.]